MTGKRSEATTASNPGLRPWLDWYADMGVVDLVVEQPVDRFGIPDLEPEEPRDASRERAAATASTGRVKAQDGPPSWVLEDDQPSTFSSQPTSGSAPAAGSGPSTIGTGGSLDDARSLAMSCNSLGALAAALQDFDGCPLKETAINLCFADGNPEAPVMMIGEAPGAQEDRQGKPFVGPSGQLLDRMLATIGLDRSKVYITNVIYWRPPGNRTPTAAEIAVCQPFLERQIELLRPKLLVFVGGIAARALLGVTQGVTKLRGKHYTYQATDDREIPAIVIFHPAYLLRQPAQKRFAWRDLLAIQEEINSF